MIGNNTPEVGGEDEGENEIKANDTSEIRPDGTVPNEEDEPEDLQFFYDEYEEDEEDEEEDEYYEDELEYSPTATNGVTFPANSQPSSGAKTSGAETSTELPDGWERHEDELGSYFWHIPTGTIQREKPFLDTIDKSMIRSDSLVFLDKSAINVDYNPADLIEEEDESKTAAGSVGKDQNDEEEDVERKALISKKKVIANLRLTFPTDDEEDPTDTEDEDPERLSFVVHSLGWLDVDESQINSQTGSMVIRRCIQQLSRKAESVRCWGPDDTQSLILRLGGEKICLLDPTTETVLSIQLIREVRMWAVDEQNYFAYVVKERASGAVAGHPKSSKVTGGSILKCHVFHCDDNGTANSSSAQRIALYLKDALIRIKNKALRNKAHATRPSKLPFGSSAKNRAERDLNSFEFPTPIEEPRKTIPAMYIGLVPVNKPMGVEVLNMAIEEIVSSLKLSLSDENDETELMRHVYVHISPSNIVVECQDTGATLVECRVRYLSFLGISLDNVKRCGFIMQVDDSQFVAHCFQAEPSAGALCKTIEAALLPQFGIFCQLLKFRIQFLVNFQDESL
ncbi:PREDICTED: amyloid beta A4 precursor protein-binding family B member 2-like [Rhagoletis zephyria]|uniref:amyloid beta A4 precursor protein-binding family B member 2-like n=1 Tax=Rhagoletis zephyria TaxID=28612 RepID=UPI0008117D9E|nr:PREDICTED: amyloid beta A4 precursor protein-binding family B member 2-like [Rhagoletis zephyria]